MPRPTTMEAPREHHWLSWFVDDGLRQVGLQEAVEFMDSTGLAEAFQDTVQPTCLAIIARHTEWQHLVALAIVRLDSPCRQHLPRTATVLGLCVDADHRGKGLGTFLYRKMHREVFAREQLSLFWSVVSGATAPARDALRFELAPGSCRRTVSALLLYARHGAMVTVAHGMDAKPWTVSMLEERLLGTSGDFNYKATVTVTFPGPLCLRGPYEHCASFGIPDTATFLPPPAASDLAPATDKWLAQNYQFSRELLQADGEEQHPLSYSPGQRFRFSTTTGTAALLLPDSWCAEIYTYINSNLSEDRETLAMKLPTEPYSTLGHLSGYSLFQRTHAAVHKGAEQQRVTKQATSKLELQMVLTCVPKLKAVFAAWLSTLGLPVGWVNELDALLKVWRGAHFLWQDERCHASFSHHADDKDLDLKPAERQRLRTLVVQLSANTPSAMCVWGREPQRFGGCGAASSFHGSAVHFTMQNNPPPAAGSPVVKMALFVVMPKR